jgi:hypothetical protein
MDRQFKGTSDQVLACHFDRKEKSHKIMFHRAKGYSGFLATLDMTTHSKRLGPR